MPRLLLFVVLAGLVIYGLVWLSMRLREQRASRATARPAPDDDPQFLAQLDRQLRERRRQEEQERRRREAATGDDAAPQDGDATKDAGENEKKEPKPESDDSSTPD
ncbi:hypothetical protein [Serinibacter arcticus]|uniref:hypothetical protein n=1 Tax=Serinibacter arcticus TaxID=1655435 RepID=UPI0018EE9DE9|nr:hypothetical protein [Serinibacter arcticus]